MSQNTKQELICIQDCKQAYHKENNTNLIVLDKVNLHLYTNEIVGLLGRSGSGKSTLLRIISGLLRPTEGKIFWKKKPLTGPTSGIAMVFQSFALFPWLTVQENVEIGLEAKGVSRAERKVLAEEAIDLIGLAGYEKAYPKELSGGMRQRVGLARALVVHPDLLLMDEPFSALDVLTAENLRTDLIELWSERKLPVKSILIVTHNIEEAVLMCDRIIIFSSNPGKVAHELTVPLPHPRSRENPAFRQLVDRIYTLMTRKEPEYVPPILTEDQPELIKSRFSRPLPDLPLHLVIGMMETLAAEPYNGRADLPKLAESLQLELDDLLPLGESLQMLGFATLEEGDIYLTSIGTEFVNSEQEQRRTIFRNNIIQRIPLVKAIRVILDERWNHRASAERFRDELEDTMSPDYAQQTLNTVTNWGRYSELFDFDEEADQFFLDEDDQVYKIESK
ncbi:ABC transporter ATP-binding protein [Entomobacter blattae]|uniref:Vitamin B12 import ATP-binding protein BtuD n=1 Tax=Entomobacter blattae TaxID=2762277 RepID=A0A7H1NT45_9PROT|nr:nitrate/sulfonate/bicarbonate ABC transporter ATP-binding protein [Entomobacter blattae]QNT78955.1 Vitamin B12 import ATP-binding protein BtuD [Entomobacter blattae]